MSVTPESELVVAPAGYSLQPCTKPLPLAAAIVGQLDLVISVDTSSAHLAAASGTATWVLLPKTGTDWRWLLDREDSPWYPGVARLFRQDSAGDWEGVVSRLVAALQEWRQDRSR